MEAPNNPPAPEVEQSDFRTLPLVYSLPGMHEMTRQRDLVYKTLEDGAELTLFRLTISFWRVREVRTFSTSGHLQRLSVSLPFKLIKAPGIMRGIGQRRLADLTGQQQVILQLEEHALNDLMMIRRKKISLLEYGK